MTESLLLIVGTGVCFLLDTFTLVWAFSGDKIDKNNRKNKSLAILFLLALLYLYAPRKLEYKYHTDVKIVAFCILIRLIYRFILVFGYLIVGKNMKYSKAYYYSMVYIVLYCSYRMMFGPASLGGLICYLLGGQLNLNTIIIGLFLMHGLGFLLATIVKKRMYMRDDDYNYYRRNWVISYEVFITILIRSVLASLGNDLSRYMYLSIVLSAIPIMLFQITLLMDAAIFNYGKLEEERFQRKTDAYRLKNIELQNARDENIRCLIHDTKNHILALKSIICKRSVDEVSQYLDSLIDNYGLNQYVVDTGNSLLDGLISMKMEEADLENIHFSVVLDGRCFEYIPETYLCTIFGNAMDNAIDACVKVSDKNKRYVDIKGGLIANQVCLSISNNYDGCNTMSGECFISTKKDPGHGFGLRSIKSAVESCNGTVRFDEDKDKFKLTIMLPYDNRAHA